MNKVTTFIEFIRQKYLRAVEKGSILQFECHTFDLNDAFVNYVVKHCPVLEHTPAKPNVFRSNYNISSSPFTEVPKEMKLSEYPEHCLIFNKYPIFPHHLLLVTREFKPQYEDLNEADFAAISMVLSELNTPFLMFYNCGPESGASQLHKHVQFVPFSSWDDIPIYSLVAETNVAQFDFWHWAVSLNTTMGTKPFDAKFLHSQYQTLMEKMRDLFGSQNYLLSYNLLMTDKWMLLVPRRQECFSTNISINSMGFGGFILAKNREEIEIIKKSGIAKILQNVSIPC